MRSSWRGNRKGQVERKGRLTKLATVFNLLLLSGHIELMLENHITESF